VVVGDTIGVVAVEVGVLAGDCGTPGENGLVLPAGASGVLDAGVVAALLALAPFAPAPAPSALAGSAPAGRASADTARRTARRARRTAREGSRDGYRSEARGCSIAGVSGEVAYGFSESWTSSWYTLSTFTDQMS
jgi:hypothetical protein